MKEKPSSEYRSVYCGILTDDRFIGLSVQAKGYFWALKFTLHTVGIAVCLPHTVAPLASLTLEQATAAEQELIAASWIRRDGAVVWIVDGLSFNPHLFAADPKHRKFVARHLRALPAKNRLVNDFREYYTAWFDGPDPSPLGDTGSPSTATIVSPSEAPSEGLSKPLRSTVVSKQQTTVSSQEVKAVVADGAGAREKLPPEQQLIIAANEGQFRNTALDQDFDPIDIGSARQRTIAREILAEIPLAFALEHAERILRERAPDSRDDAVRSMQYLRKPLASEWSKHKIRANAAPSADPTPDVLKLLA